MKNSVFLYWKSEHVFRFVLVAVLLLEAGCGGGSSTNGGGAPSITSVTVSGSPYSQAGFCANFTATVSGTGNFDHSVQWYVNGVAGGDASDGLISSSGNYCAPPTLPATNPVSIKAVANGDTTKFGTATTTVVSIQVSPTQAQLYVGNTQQFTATVAGTTGGVTWEVSGIPGGNSTVGTISPGGLYTAPAQVTNQGIAVEAVLSAATSVYASANITVSGLINISPPNPQLSYGGSQQFTAQVIGTTDTQVNWRATYGSIDSSGLYTASATQSPDTVYAWTPNANGSTTVTILGLKPVITSISPQPATAGDQLTITGQNLNSILTAEFPNAIGGTISVGSNAIGTSATVTVPQGSVTGQFYVIAAQGGLSPQQSNSVQFQRLARLRIRTPQNDVGAGESIDFKYALLGDSTPQTVTFTADQGTFSGSSYLAPASVASDSFVHVSACITGTQSCDSLMLGLHPFRITPNVPLVPLGGVLQLSDVGATSGPAWTLLAGGGSLQQDGLYTAGTSVQSGGPALISASSSGVTEQTSVGVTGAFPGLLNRVYDYIDQHTQNPLGTYSSGLAMSGSRLYVAASNYEGNSTNSYFWIDVYDISDALHPVWLTAVEANSSGSVFATGQYLYSYTGCDFAIPGCPSTVTLYSIQSGVPVLKAQAQVPQWWNIADNDGVLTLIPFDDQVIEYNLTNGTIASTTLNLTLPSDANQFIPDTSLAVGNRLFVSVETNDLSQGGYILTYDLSTSPPNLLGTVNARSLAFYASGNLLFGALGGMEIYDISQQLPVEEGYIDGINARELIGTQLLATTEQQGCEMVDVSNPQQPKVTSILFDGVIVGGECGPLVGSYVYESEIGGGIAIYDASMTGGPIRQEILYGGPYGSSASNDLLLESNILYAATSTFAGPALEVYDVSTTPANRLGEYVPGDPSQGGFSVQGASHYVYFGMSKSIGVIDVTQPSSPTLAGTVATPAIGSLARGNNSLYAGGGNNTLIVLDITNPAQPAIVKTITLSDLPIKVRVFGNLLLVADNAAGLLIYDVSTPQSPVLLSTMNSFTLVEDVTIQGTTAYVAADVDGLGIVDISNPSQPVLLSKTGLGRSYPFDGSTPLNEALTVSLAGGLVYVGTVNDNGIVFGLDCSNRVVPRIVSAIAYGDFVETWSGTLLFNGSELFVGGALNAGVYPVTEADASHPFDSINQYFPPSALQNPLTLSQSVRARARAHFQLKNHPKAEGANRFYRSRQ
jgi:hypothetical protein